MSRRPSTRYNAPVQAPVPDRSAPLAPAGGLGALVALWVVTTLLLLAVHGPTLWEPGELGDERVYREAFAAVRAGVPLTSVEIWFYPDHSARWGAALEAALGTEGFWRGLRLVNLAGAAAAVAWCAAELGGRGGRVWLARLGVAGAVALFPATDTAVTVGNVSGVLLLALLLTVLLPAPLRALPLGASFLLKPYGLALALGERAWIAAVALGCAFLGWLDTSNRSAFANLDSIRNNAPVRALHELGLPLPWQVVTAGVVLVAARLRLRGPAALALGWLTLPIAWDHTGLLAYPALGVALAQPPRPAGDARLGRLLAVLAGVVLAYGGYFGTDDAAPAVSGILGLAPAAAVVGLVAVAARRTGA